MAENSLKDLREFFSTAERPVTTPEMAAFWKSCSDDEKAYFKSADLA